MKFLYDSTKSKMLDRAKYIFDYNLQYDRFNRRIERANPAQSNALSLKGFDRFHAQNE
ncbi:MAG TPA: hypothetical protein VEW92_00260 [Nitrososphaeraceae archaeon]|nr:hypothetical protein [Nitrososphaeraceae archaeon]